MLTRLAADPVTVVYRTLSLVSVVCCGLVVLSFAMFANDQLSSASHHQVAEITRGVGTPSRPPAVHEPGQPGRFIDGVANRLTAPFRMIVESDNQWVQHGLETVFALAVYGVGLGFLARYSRV